MLKSWYGPGYQITLLSDGQFQLEFFDGDPVVVSRAEFKAILRTMQSADKYASTEFDHPATRLDQLPPD